MIQFRYLEVEEKSGMMACGRKKLTEDHGWWQWGWLESKLSKPQIVRDKLKRWEDRNIWVNIGVSILHFIPSQNLISLTCHIRVKNNRPLVEVPFLTASSCYIFTVKSSKSSALFPMVTTHIALLLVLSWLHKHVYVIIQIWIWGGKVLSPKMTIK